MTVAPYHHHPASSSCGEISHFVRAAVGDHSATFPNACDKLQEKPVVLMRRCFMISFSAQASVGDHEASKLLELAEEALTARSLEEFAELTLPNIAGLAGSRSALLYLADPRVPQPRFFQFGYEAGTALKLENICAKVDRELGGARSVEGRQSGYTSGIEVSDAADSPITHDAPPDADAGSDFLLYTLGRRKAWSALLGIAPAGTPSSRPATLNDRVLDLLASAIERLLERARLQRQLVQLSTYQVVSSTLTQTVDLNQLLDTILSCCVGAVSAREASALLLDSEREHFCFYQMEGECKPSLLGITFPADKGIAGAVLKSQEPEIIHDAWEDPRFYKAIDEMSGFRTESLITVPLTEGEERIGVIEVLNKEGGGSFTAEDLNLLVSIAEEVAYGIRNSIMFEYVVNTYCQQRKGHNTCAGCKRPLGSWTPCVKYREVAT
jgi:GAF domain-containing protein